jgi:hypothetical protein
MTRIIVIFILSAGRECFLCMKCKKKYTSENDPLQAQITMREFQFFESIIKKKYFLNVQMIITTLAMQSNPQPFATCIQD